MRERPLSVGKARDLGTSDLSTSTRAPRRRRSRPGSGQARSPLRRVTGHLASGSPQGNGINKGKHLWVAMEKASGRGRRLVRLAVGGQVAPG